MATNIDSLGVGKALELFPEQVKSAWTEAFSFDLPKYNPKAVIISGMGGSSNAAKILEGLYEGNFRVPYDIDVHNDYDLPIWVDKDSLVIANSYSGNTEETLSGVVAARKVGARVIGVTTGGKLGELIKSKEIEGVIVNGTQTNPTGFPKTGLGISFGALLGTLAKIGIVAVSQDELFSALDNLVEIKKQWKAKEMANSLHGCLPVLMGARPLIGSLNTARNAMCEIGRTYTQFYDLPEADHVFIEATLKPAVAKEQNRYLFFESNFYHERVQLRFKITKDIFDKQGIIHSTYRLQGSTPLAQALEIPYLCSWIGYHLSLLDNSDPGPEPWILELKNRLS